MRRPDPSSSASRPSVTKNDCRARWNSVLHRPVSALNEILGLESVSHGADSDGIRTGPVAGRANNAYQIEIANQKTEQERLIQLENQGIMMQVLRGVLQTLPRR